MVKLIGVAVSLGLFTFASAGLLGKNWNSYQISRAFFEPNGDARLPVNYRQWANVGTRYKVGGMNILDGTPVKVPQVLNTYVEPSALADYKSTGKWPDGTQIVKELTQVKGGTDCDVTSFICATTLGTGIFEERHIGVGLMVKDRERFPAEPGNWAYFAFFRRASGYDRTAKERPRQQCSACHVKLASDTDYVIVKAHLGLSADNIQ